MITRLDSISGVNISVLASSVVKHDYNAGSISSVIISVLASSVELVIMIYHTRSQHTNNYTTDTVQVLASSVVNHDYKAGQYHWCKY
jgi:hypothetical protein